MIEPAQLCPHNQHLRLENGYPEWILKASLSSSLSKWRSKDQEEVCNIHDLLISLKFCKKEKDLQCGKVMHAKALEVWTTLDIYVLNALVSMYCKCHSLISAREVFNSIENPDLVSWNALLLGYAENGQELTALNLFSVMKEAGHVPDPRTYLVCIKACTYLVSYADDEKGKMDCLERGMRIHDEISDRLDPYLLNAMVAMYGKCGSMLNARRVFDSMQKPDLVSWNALLLGYADNGEGYICLKLINRMKESGIRPNSITYLVALKACTSVAVTASDIEKIACLQWGRQIHSEIGPYLDRYIETTLINMYAKCGSIVEARFVFDNMQNPGVVSWTALLLGYVENGEANVAMHLFSKMKECGCAPNSLTYVAVLKACSSMAASKDSDKNHYLNVGRDVHSEIGPYLDQYVEAALVNMYSKCGSMVDARRVFDNVGKPGVVAWTALLLGYVDNGEGQAVIDLFFEMKERGCTPNSFTYVAVFKACGMVGALSFGRKFHSEMNEFQTSSHVVTSLVDFYAKCGSMLEAQKTFDLHLKTRDITTWTSLLAGYSMFGDTDSAFKVFQGMQDEGLRPNAVTFVCLLLCCSHAGLVERATNYFDLMSVQYRVTPTIMHYNCMVDVFGRANQLLKAIRMIRQMPCDPDVVTWTTLLCACKKWKNAEIGREAFQALSCMDKKSASTYVLMSHSV